MKPETHTIEEMREQTKQILSTVSPEERGIVFEIGGEGGAIRIFKKRIKTKYVFIYQHNEQDFSDEELSVNKTAKYDSFESAFQQINTLYSIYFLYILTVHKNYKEYVSDQLVKKLNNDNISFEDFNNRERFEEILNIKLCFNSTKKMWLKSVENIDKLINEDNSINFDEYNSIFARIENSETEEELKRIAAEYDLSLIENKYPRLGMKISAEEILELKESKVLTVDIDNNLTINQERLNPIAKLLYALVWKQGDLQKLKQIIQGIEEVENPDKDKKDALVFYCYGNHLGNPTKFPIIDQHVVRAFNLFKDSSNSDSVRKSDKVYQIDRQNYLHWYSKFENKNSDFLYFLDRLLFEIGRAVKLK